MGVLAIPLVATLLTFDGARVIACTAFLTSVAVLRQLVTYLDQRASRPIVGLLILAQLCLLLVLPAIQSNWEVIGQYVARELLTPVSYLVETFEDWSTSIAPTGDLK